MIKVTRPDDGTVVMLTPRQYAAEYGDAALMRAMAGTPREEMTNHQSDLAARMQAEAEASAAMREASLTLPDILRDE